ncbi:MAG: DsbA family protein [Bacteroidota bacterium]
MNKQPEVICDPITGICTIPTFEGEANESIEFREDIEIIYVGDPMCSWCWGISPALHELEQQAKQSGIAFRIVVGGLRPGGGDEWNEKFTNFLAHHWEEVNQRSGQPFNHGLFQLDDFNYDTEPSCRAVVAARAIDSSKEHPFFELVQHHFYVQNQDPNRVDFYEPICKKLELDFGEFKTLFESVEIKKRTQSEFAINRQWGVRGYPTVLLRKQDQLHLLARGYSSSKKMWERLEDVVNVES